MTSAEEASSTGVILDIPQDHEITDQVRRCGRWINSERFDTAAGSPAVPLSKERLKKGNRIRMSHHVRKVSRELVLGAGFDSTSNFVTDTEASPSLTVGNGAQQTVLILISRRGGERVTQYL